MTNERQIVAASLAALRDLSLEQLQKERAEIADHIREAVQAATMMIDFVIAEKQHHRTIN